MAIKRRYGLKWGGPVAPHIARFDLEKAGGYDPKITSVDLRPLFPPCFDQGQLGSCVDNACAGLICYLQATEKLSPQFMPSRLYLYYYARSIMGSQYIMQDSGSTVQNGVQSMQHGFCSEKSWPYSDNAIQFRLKPWPWCDSSAKQHQIVGSDYQSVPQDLNSFRAALQARNPILIGISVYDSFESQTVAQTGIVPIPNTSTEQLLGGHCLLIVGYDDSKQWFIVRNSWGSGSAWGDNGYCYIPYGYIMNPSLSSDFWCVTDIT
jgi:C1A family cysteine protease